MKLQFQKNNRGYSEFAFRILRATVINSGKILYRPRNTNVHNIPQRGPCFIYGNHSNYFDPFLINIPFVNEPTAGVMTREQFHKPIPALFMDSIGIVPTSKYVPEPGVVRSVLKMIDQNRMIVIFPEGGRRWDGKPKPIIESTIKLFWKMKIPVHPVQIHGSYVGWPRWADFPRPCSVENRWMDPLYPSDFNDYESFLKTCNAQLDFDEYFPPIDTYPRMAWKPAAGIERLLYRCPVTGNFGGMYSPDGHRVLSRYATISYTMNERSELINTNGEPISLIDVYDEINKMPLEVNKKGYVFKATRCPVHYMGSDYKLKPLHDADISLHLDHICLLFPSEKKYIPLSEIRYVSIEQNNKLSLTLSDATLQIDLEGFSALAWQTIIRRLQYKP